MVWPPPRVVVSQVGPWRATSGHKPPPPAGASQIPGGVAPESRSHGAWPRGSGTCPGSQKNEQSAVLSTAQRGHLWMLQPLGGPPLTPPAVQASWQPCPTSGQPCTPTSSGTGCWCHGDRCRGTGLLSPWRRPPGPCSSSSASRSAESGAQSSCVSRERSSQPSAGLAQHPPLPRRWRHLPPHCQRPTHHEQREHGLRHVEAVAPVVVGDPAVAFAHGEQEPHQDLRGLGTGFPPRFLGRLPHSWPSAWDWPPRPAGGMRATAQGSQGLRPIVQPQTGKSTPARGLARFRGNCPF